MIYDPVEKRIIMYGGAHWDNYYHFYDELWSYKYETNTWTPIETPSSPRPRFNMMITYMNDRHQLFMFGGFSRGARRAGDTWIYDIDSNTWMELHPDDHPSPRSDASISYDPVNDIIVLFSGYLYDDSHLQDTWIYSFKEENWIMQDPQNSPLGQYGHHMVYSDITGQLLLYPGHWCIYSNGNMINHGYGGNIWEYNVLEDRWFEYNSERTPPGRYWGNLIYDSKENRLILFGGHGAIDYYDTWTYSIEDGIWEKVIQNVTPSKRGSSSMAYDPDNHVAVLFGGISDNGESLGDTWILDCETLIWSRSDLSQEETHEEPKNTAIPGFPVLSTILALLSLIFKVQRKPILKK
jgi:hypothetical protein